MGPPATPSKSKNNIDHIIDQLNARWKLQLTPDILASPQSKTAMQNEPPAQQCVRRLRFLFYKNQIALEKLIKDYEDWARPIASGWKWKARQEEGTLPLRPVDESHLLRNPLLEQIDVTESKREELVARLLKVLKDEIQLLQSDSPKTSFEDGGRPARPTQASKEVTNLPEIQGAEKASMLDMFQRTRSLGVDSKSSVGSSVKPKTRDSKRKSTETEVFFSALSSPLLSENSSFVDSDCFDDFDFDFEHLNLNLDTLSLHSRTIEADTDHNGVQNSEPAPPNKKSKPPISIRNYMTVPALKDEPRKLVDAPNFAAPATSPPLPPSASGEAPRKSNDYVALSFISDSSRATEPSSIFTQQMADEPSTQDTEIIMNDLFQSFGASEEFPPNDDVNDKRRSSGNLKNDGIKGMSPRKVQRTQAEPLTDPTAAGDSAFQSMKEVLSLDLAKSKSIPSHSVPPQVQVGETKVHRELLVDGPFSESMNDGLHTLSIRYSYEISRIAKAWQIPVANLAKSVSTESYSAFWNCIKDLARGRSLPDKSQLKAWDAATDTFNVVDPGHSVQFTGKLSWREKGSGIFQLHLNPLRIDKSCRLYRKFGAHRFLNILIPTLGEGQLPEKLKRDSSARKRIADWLSTAEHNLLGRRWRSFFVEQESAKVKAGTPPGYRIHLFAVHGDGIQDMSLANMINWHIPLSNNHMSTECKVFQRFSLGLSKATPTTVLRPSEFIHLRDMKPTGSLDSKFVMNDGCARISRSLARDIANKLGLKSVPSVFQARIAGAKGLWMVDSDEELARSAASHEDLVRSATSDRGFYIEVTDSQLKIKPHPRYIPSADADDEKLTFEVVQFSTPLKPAHINHQLLAILQDRGVDLKRLERLQQLDLQHIYEPLISSKDDRLSCRHWIQSHCPTGEQRSGNKRELEIRVEGALPASHVETVALLLESGFEPNECSFLVDKVKMILKAHLDRHLEKLRIQVPLSTYAYCIADPYKCLKPDEVHLGFSNNWVDEAEDLFADNILHGMDILVARFPAHLPSDIQRRRAVWNERLRHFKDAIVFPTTGDRPLADLLSGGDYDGDQSWICWDPALVSSFQNVIPDPAEDQTFDYFDIIKNTQTMVQTEGEIDGFLSRCFDFNLYPTFLGSVSDEHEMVQYHEAAGVSHPGAKELAVLAGLLVDAPKQGYHFPDQAWYKFRSQISPIQRLRPAYKPQKPGDGPSAKKRVSNYLDYLKFWVAEPLKSKFLEDFQQQWVGGANVLTTKDSDLSRVWHYSVERANLEKSQGHPEFHQILNHLREDVKRVSDNFVRRASKSDDQNSNFAENMKALDREFQAIEPLRVEHEILKQIDRDAKERPPCLSIWPWLRALCAHETRHKSKFSWLAAGDILCLIKAFHRKDGLEHVRGITEDIYAAMKTDSKIVKRIQAREDPEDEWDLDDEFDDMMMGLMESGEWD